MTVSPDQFQRRVRVRLPFADRYLAGGDPGKAARAELRAAFQKPLFTAAITPEPRAGNPQGDGHHGPNPNPSLGQGFQCPRPPCGDSE